MTEWRIKEISDLTKISIRMLRHYDKIDLLKPSYGSPNGYRCYTEQDLGLNFLTLDGTLFEVCQ